MKKFMILLFTLMVAIDGYSQTRVICGTCNGYKRLLCPNCGGAGYVLQPYYNPYYGWMQQNVPCGRCGGYGSLVCGNCRGSGVVIVNNRYSGPSFKGQTSWFKKTSNKCRTCKGGNGCSGYWGIYHTNGTYEGRCSNSDGWGHTCGHSPEHHGLKSW